MMGKVIHVVKLGTFVLKYVECEDGSVTACLYSPKSLWAVAYARMGMGVYGAWAADVSSDATQIMEGLL